MGDADAGPDPEGAKASGKTFTFACPKCAADVAMPRIAAGQRRACPACQAKVKVPEPGAPAAPPAQSSGGASVRFLDRERHFVGLAVVQAAYALMLCGAAAVIALVMAADRDYDGAAIAASVPLVMGLLSAVTVPGLWRYGNWARYATQLVLFLHVVPFTCFTVFVATKVFLVWPQVALKLVWVIGCGKALTGVSAKAICNPAYKERIAEQTDVKVPALTSYLLWLGLLVCGNDAIVMLIGAGTHR